MTSRSLLLIGAAVVFTMVGYASVGPRATGASEDLGAAANGLHGYMHGAWGNSHGSHGWDVTTNGLHATLLDYDGGSASECDVATQRGVVDASWVSMTDTFVQNGVFSDPGTRARYYQNLGLYAEVKAQTKGASCP